MCTIVYIEDKDVRTVGELKAAIGPEHVTYAFDVIDYVDEECLCGVRIRESAERAGYECRDFGMDFEFIKKPESVMADWNSLSQEQWRAFLESRVANLRGKSAKELKEAWRSSANVAFDTGTEANRHGQLIFDCAYAPTSSGDCIRVDAWLAGWLYASAVYDRDQSESEARDGEA